MAQESNQESRAHHTRVLQLPTGATCKLAWWCLPAAHLVPARQPRQHHQPGRSLIQAFRSPHSPPTAGSHHDCASHCGAQARQRQAALGGAAACARAWLESCSQAMMHRRSLLLEHPHRECRLAHPSGTWKKAGRPAAIDQELKSVHCCSPSCCCCCVKCVSLHPRQRSGLLLSSKTSIYQASPAY